MNTIEKKSVKVGKYVNAEHVSSLVRKYKQERWVQNSERLGKEDSLNVWYSTEELEEFIQTAKACGADGIRICFGVYGESNGRPGTEGCQTVALVATQSAEGENVDGIAPQGDLYINKNGKSELLAYNAGGLFWPIPGSTTTIGTTIVTDKAGMRVI